MRTVVRWLSCAAVVAVMAVAFVPRAQAQSDTSDAERRARRARQGAGLRVGIWNTSGLPAGTDWPMFEGYFQKGLDQHLVLETSVGLWRHEQRPSGGGVIRAYVVPQLTQLKFYPATTPEQQLEPYLAGGVGLTIGIDNREGAAGGLFGGSGAGTQLQAGIGLKGSVGVEYHLGRLLGVAGYVGYQYVYFLESFAGAQSYKGMVAGGGLTYRYQF